MKRKISFGKLPYFYLDQQGHVTGGYAQGKRVCKYEVELELDENNNFSASAMLWNQRHTDCLLGGQCLDDPSILFVLGKNPTYKEILRLWRLYHLNDMHAGTPAQEEALRAHREQEGYRGDYDRDCEFLKSVDLYEVEYQGQPYKYGHAWLKWEIPEEDLEAIKKLLS